MAEQQHIPELPRALIDPRPVLGIGTLLWGIAALAVWFNDAWHSYRPLCLMGIAIGVLGFSLYYIQLRGARRGDRGAQTGLL